MAETGEEWRRGLAAWLLFPSLPLGEVKGFCSTDLTTRLASTQLGDVRGRGRRESADQIRSGCGSGSSLTPRRSS